MTNETYFKGYIKALNLAQILINLIQSVALMNGSKPHA